MDHTLRQLQEATQKLSKLNWANSNPLSALNQTQDIFNQDFWNNMNQITSFAAAQNQEPTTSPPRIRPVPVDIFETLSKIIVCCELPGLDRNSLKLSISRGSVLTMQGKIKGHDLSEYRVSQERHYGKMHRQIRLPGEVLKDGIQTIYKDGLLEIQLSKKLGSPDRGTEWEVNCDL